MWSNSTVSDERDEHLLQDGGGHFRIPTCRPLISANAACNQFISGFEALDNRRGRRAMRSTDEP